MKKINLFPVIVLSILVLASCESLVNDVALSRLPVSDRQIVVHGYLAPQDSMLMIKAGYSTPIFGEKTYINTTPTNTPIANLGFNVTISDGSKTVKLNYVAAGSDAQNSNYQLSVKQLPIVAGKTYSLKITGTDGKTVTSSCTIPKNIAIKEVKEDSLRYTPQGNNAVPTIAKAFRINWQDPVGLGQYYRISGTVTELTRQTQQAGQVPREIVYQTPLNFTDRFGDFLDDTNTDGQPMTSGNGVWNKINRGANIIVISQAVVLMLIVSDKNYYDYHLATRNFTRNNPFAEPTLMPSNIIGGVGCFAGYNRSIVTIR